MCFVGGLLGLCGSVVIVCVCDWEGEMGVCVCVCFVGGLFGLCGSVDIVCVWGVLGEMGGCVCFVGGLWL